MRAFGIGVLGLLAAYVSAAPPAEQTVEQIVERHKKSVVVVTTSGRDGRRQGVGTGFIVSADGLIATNWHVIGEGRAIGVELADGKKYDAIAVHATERRADLAVIRIAAKELPALELGDSDKLKDGQAVVGLGNPQGLKHSVVGGVVSGKRNVDGLDLIQLAIPLEPGNSGGPLLDRFGKAQGILTLKSAVTENLGFALPINALKPLLAKPNPVPMEKWLTIGALDADEWETLFGARWRQRAGRLSVDGTGQGFGGRALCLSRKSLPDLPCEFAVTVRLGDEAGAAGLVFHADGGEKHYGFYPSNGELRLTRFDGPDVFTWKILAQKRSEHYRPGEWNTLKVRLDKDRFKCFVNDQLVVESDDAVYGAGKVGIAKFRDTTAEFKQFRVGRALPAAVAPAAAARLRDAITRLDAAHPAGAADVTLLAGQPAASLLLLRERARQLEQQAAQLRQLATDVHQQAVRLELTRLLAQDESRIDLAHAALLVARLDNDEVDVDLYREEIERMARRLAAGLPKNAEDKARLAVLNKYFFEERGFHGSRGDYYHHSNSYLNEVIDDREGLPITLSILYLELARRVGLRMEGVGLPGHFVVRLLPSQGEPQLIDVFEGGQTLSRAAAEQKVAGTAGVPLADEHFKAIGKKAIIMRVLSNLLRLAGSDRDTEGALRYLNAMVELAPDAGRERWMRAVLRYQSGKKAPAREDVDWLLDHAPPGVNLREVRELKQLLER